MMEKNNAIVSEVKFNKSEMMKGLEELKSVLDKYNMQIEVKIEGSQISSWSVKFPYTQIEVNCGSTDFGSWFVEEMMEGWE